MQKNHPTRYPIANIIKAKQAQLMPRDSGRNRQPRPPNSNSSANQSTGRGQMSNPNNWQEEAMRRLRQMQTRGGYPGRGGPQMPRGANGALIGGILLAGGAWVLSNSLFNVDGGHRAIKYQRLRGVSKEIYSEGKHGSRWRSCWRLLVYAGHSANITFNGRKIN